MGNSMGMSYIYTAVLLVIVVCSSLFTYWSPTFNLHKPDKHTGFSSWGEWGG